MSEHSLSQYLDASIAAAFATTKAEALIVMMVESDLRLADRERTLRDVGHEPEPPAAQGRQVDAFGGIGWSGTPCRSRPQPTRLLQLLSRNVSAGKGLHTRLRFEAGEP